MNLIDQIKHINHHFPMIVLLKKLNIIPNYYNMNNRFSCPIHKGNNPTTCHINDSNQIHCWKCSKYFDIVTVYKVIRNIDDNNVAIKRINYFMKSTEFKELINNESQIQTNQAVSTAYSNQKHNNTNLFKEEHSLDEKEINIKKKQLFKEISPLFNKVRDYYHNLLIANKNNKSQVALDYLVNTRNLTLDTIKEFKLGYTPYSGNIYSFGLSNYSKKHQLHMSKFLECGLIKKKVNKQNKIYYHDAFHGSIIIPIENGSSKTYHFYQNHFQKVEYYLPKYQSLTNFSQTPTFNFSFRFFEALPFIKEAKIMIIHEGFFDVISCFQNNIKNAVAIICVAQLFSQSQIDILKKNNIKVIIGFDNDTTGHQRSNALAQQLKNNNIQHEVRYILSQYSTCKDADELLKKFGKEAYHDCYLNTYQEYQHNRDNFSIELATKIFGQDKIQILENEVE